jgi:hypothetical protein
VRVVPRAVRDALAGERDGALLVRLTAPPVEGAANAALVKLLGAAFGVRPSAVRILRGASARDKLVHVAGLTVASARARLGAA